MKIGLLTSGGEGTLAGAVQDTQNELSGDLGLSYRAGELSARLAGPNVTGGGVLALENGRYDLTLNSGPVTLARLLPDGLDVQRLNFAGSLEARGTLARGPERVVARNLALRIDPLGARMALTVTGMGGLAMIAGCLILGQIAGSYRLSDILLVREGRVVAQGPIEITLTAENLSRTFGLDLVLEKHGERWSARATM